MVLTGIEEGLVVVNRIQSEDYRKLTANGGYRKLTANEGGYRKLTANGGGGGVIRTLQNLIGEDQVRFVLTQPKFSGDK